LNGRNPTIFPLVAERDKHHWGVREADFAHQAQSHSKSPSPLPSPRGRGGKRASQLRATRYSDAPVSLSRYAGRGQGGRGEGDLELQCPPVPVVGNGSGGIDRRVPQVAVPRDLCLRSAEKHRSRSTATCGTHQGNSN
jgi:hypothetical protein